MPRAKCESYKIISDDGTDLWMEFKCGSKVVINSVDKWIFDVFSSFGISGSKSKYVFVARQIQTEYSALTERIYLHRVIVKPKGKEQVDHKDRDRFNNRRDNLRICTMRQNMANIAPKYESKYKGVYDRNRGQDRKLKKPFVTYMAFLDAKSRIQKREYLGYYSTPEEPARAYDKRAREVWGEFAYLNFPDDYK